MTYTPDPAVVYELAADVVLDCAREIDYGGIGEKYEDHIAFEDLSDDDRETLQKAVHDVAQAATVTISFDGCDDEWSTEEDGD